MANGAAIWEDAKMVDDRTRTEDSSYVDTDTKSESNSALHKKKDDYSRLE